MTVDAAAFEALAATVGACVRCREMDHCHTLSWSNGSPSNGSLAAAVLFLGEAPGRLGAARSGVPFEGDRSGDRFASLLAEAGLEREQVFVTNAVLCSPLSPAGANRRPRVSEVASCLPHLRATLALVEAPVVAALGGVALDSLARIERHEVRSVVREAGRPRPWRGRTLVPLVHPSGRALGRRSEAQQRRDWRGLGTLVRALAASEVGAR